MTCTKNIAAFMLSIAASLAFAADVPPILKASDNEVSSLQSKATGVQIYICSPRKDDPSKFEWAFRAPEAELFDASGKERIGRHYAGPTWESSDGSKVVAEVKARDNGPDANAIPWLLLKATFNSGDGVFAKTSSIQRIATSGGKAPPDGCDAGQSGKEARVPYTATYVFFSRR